MNLEKSLFVFVFGFLISVHPLCAQGKDPAAGTDEELVAVLAIAVNSPITKMPDGSIQTAIGTLYSDKNGNFSTPFGDVKKLQDGNFSTPFGDFLSDGEGGFRTNFGHVISLGHGRYLTPLGIASVTTAPSTQTHGSTITPSYFKVPGEKQIDDNSPYFNIPKDAIRTDRVPPSNR